jgi:hypothetical protein
VQSDTRSAAFSASFASTTARIRDSSSRCCVITSARPGSSDTSPKHAQPALKVQTPANFGVLQPREWPQMAAWDS